MSNYTFTQSELDAIAEEVTNYSQREDPDVRTDYVGRAYANPCVGIVLRHESSIPLVTALMARRIAEQHIELHYGEQREPTHEEVLENIADLAASQKTDGMGLDIIVYWWCVTLRSE